MLRRAAEAARLAPPAGGAFDLLLVGLGVRFTDGYADAAPLLEQALRALRDDDCRVARDPRWPGVARAVALDVFDADACHVLAARSVELARERGALGVLPLALNYLAAVRAFEGDLATAEAMLQEADAIADATGGARIGWAGMTVAGFRGDETVASALAAVAPAATERREGVALGFGEHACALVYNGLRRYEEALPAARQASAGDELTVSTWALPELVEAAVGSGRGDAAAAAFARLSERTRAAGTELALGIEARSRALLSEGAAADALYREAIDRLGRCRLAPDRARAHLLYGEWLRRETRDAEAGEQLHAAHDSFAAMGMYAFAERARLELLAAGQKARKRAAETRDGLTPQEAQIAQLASDGYSNPEIGARLFLSPRTVEWHLGKVFTKLAISSRRELRAALPRRAPDPQLA
jgi:DNA-binding CsgD family transcriptional regulator